MDFNLIIYWPGFAGALVLLFFPPSLWLSNNTKSQLAHQRSAGSFKILRGIMAWQNWADLIRGYAGCHLLFQFALEAPEGQEWELLGWQGGILLFSLLIQTVRRHHRRTYFLAPVFFVWGISFFLLGPLLTLYGIVVGALVAGVSENLEWKLPVMAVVAVAAGYLLSGFSLELALAGVLIVFPLIVTFCGRGHMVFLMREKGADG